ncbi:MAG: putative O-glycosylation ligase, exosortase system-associated [Rhodocyclales bacterium]|nr:putative O-glycosylation ligase, exosortase system-associated [Rhodocyclales bacterium]
MRGLMITFLYLLMFGCGFQIPSVMALAYMWTDLVRPQYVAYSLITTLPLSMICAMLAIPAWFFCKDKPRRITFGTMVLIIWAIWMTISTFTAVVQDAAWDKWNFAFKAAVFAVLLPYFFNTRAQIEAAILTVLLSVGMNVISIGAKTIINGGGYGVDLGVTGGGYGLTEGSMFAMASASLIPLFFWGGKYSILLPGGWIRKLLVWGMVALSISASLGTFARTGLVSMGVLAVAGFFAAKRKILYVIIVFMIGSSMAGFMGSAWTERMDTMKSAEGDSSAMGRVAAWLWTIDYVKEHPLGGGFDIYRTNTVQVQMADGNMLVEHGKAFHSIYFEVLGELGFPGIAMFLSMLAWFLLSMLRVRRLTRKRPEYAWVSDAATGLFIATLVFMAGGAFVGVAFQPYYWYLFGIGIAVIHFADRELADKLPVTS